jgi:hypothetical protein
LREQKNPSHNRKSRADYRHFCKSRRKADIAIIACVYAGFTHIFNFGTVACEAPQVKTLLQVAVKTGFYCMMELVAKLGPGPSS